MKLTSKILLVLISTLMISIPAIAQEKMIAVKAPDLTVKEIKCGPGNKLQFTVANIGVAPLPAGWMAVADVFFDGVKKGHIDLGRPTSGNLTPAGGSATYLAAFDIERAVAVKVFADATNSVKESNEGNNVMSVQISPCEQVKKPDLTVIGFSHDDRVYVLMVTIKNIGTGIVPRGGILQVSVNGSLVDTINLDSITTYPGQDFHQPGEATVVSTRWHFPSSKTFVTYNVSATIDATNVIPELNEANNTFSRPEQCPPH